MRDPEAARRAGLRRFTKRDCAVCHYVKGSHVAVHRKPALDVDKAWETLAHPSRRGAGPGPNPAAAPEGLGGARARSTSGPPPAASCHQGPQMGYQLSLWRMSPHAQAYAVLATPAGRRDGEEGGRAEDPQLRPPA